MPFFHANNTGQLESVSRKKRSLGQTRASREKLADADDVKTRP